MGFSTFAGRKYNSLKRSARSGRKISFFQVHHGATPNGNWMISTMVDPGGKEVSANYVQLTSGESVGIVDELFRAWTSASSYDDISITVETQNLSVVGWTISEAAYIGLARLAADASIRYGFGLNRNTVIGHKELYIRFGVSYPTACPGGIDLDKLVRLSIEERSKIINGGAIPPANSGDLELTMGQFEDLKSDLNRLKTNDDNIGARILEVEGRLAELIAREGRGARTFRNTATDEYFFGNLATGLWLPLGKGDQGKNSHSLLTTAGASQNSVIDRAPDIMTWYAMVAGTASGVDARILDELKAQTTKVADLIKKDPAFLKQLSQDAGPTTRAALLATGLAPEVSQADSHGQA